MSGFIYKVPQLEPPFVYTVMRKHTRSLTVLSVQQSDFCFLPRAQRPSVKFSVPACVFPQGRTPLSGMLISRIEDGENLRNAFEISGAFLLPATPGPHYLGALRYRCIPERQGEEFCFFEGLFLSADVPHTLTLWLCR